MANRPAKTLPRAAGAAHTQALSRGLAVLDALAATEGGATLTALAHALDLPAPTAHRLLATLAEAGYVVQGDGGLWRVGVRAFRAGSAFLLHRNLVAQAYPFLQRLMDDAGETTPLKFPVTKGGYEGGSPPRGPEPDRAVPGQGPGSYGRVPWGYEGGGGPRNALGRLGELLGHGRRFHPLRGSPGLPHQAHRTE